MHPPCGCWSIARRGVTNLPRARGRELAAVECALFSQKVAKECIRSRTPFSLENPSTSKLWAFDPILRLLGDPSVHRVDFDMCMYGCDYKKPTTLATNIVSLQDLHHKCCHQFRHRRLEGQVRVQTESGAWRWRSATETAGRYPEQLVRQWVALLQCDARIQVRSAAELAANIDSSLERLARRCPPIEASKGTAASRYLAKHDVVFGGSVGFLPRGSHIEAQTAIAIASTGSRGSGQS